MKFFRRYFLLILALLLIDAGLIFLAYPPVSSWLFEEHATQVIEEYESSSQDLDVQTIEAMKEEARKYNESLIDSSERFLDYSDVNRDYDSLLDPHGNGWMGSIEIEAIDVYLPIYHGCSSQVLAQGIGHVQGSSLPVGGKGTHCVLTGHCGVPTAELFTRLDELEEGDIIHLSILDEDLYYVVCDTEIVDPEDIDSVSIDPNKDELTLLTCTPYGVNSMRLLVHAQAAAFVVQQEEVQIIEVEYSACWLFWLLFVCFLCAMLILLFVKKRKKKTK
jgi:sortase A